jgi:DNA-binding transcriptional LysR family regulator
MLESDLPFRLLDLNLLRVLDAMMAEGSVARAATRLSITPSAVSHALGRLRSLFNDPLFVRSASGMRATPRGSEIGAKVREGLHFLEGALTPTDFLAEESGRTFTVACSAYVSAVLLPGAIALMRERAPRTHLAVVSWGPGVLDRFDSGQIDVLLGDFGHVPDGYEARALFEDRLVWLMGREYVLTPGMADRRLRIQAVKPDLSSRVVWENGFERRTGLEEYCGMVGNPVDGIEYRPALDSLPYSMIAPLVVKQTDLAALLPRRVACLFARDLRLDVVDPERDASTEEIRIAAIRHPDHGGRAPVAWFCELLEEAASALKRDGERAPRIPELRAGEPASSEKDARGSSRTLSPAEDKGPLECKRPAIRA